MNMTLQPEARFSVLHSPEQENVQTCWHVYDRRKRTLSVNMSQEKAAQLAASLNTLDQQDTHEQLIRQWHEANHE